MRSKEDIIGLAEEKLDDAECLFSNKRFNSAYYIAGYVIELLLKAKICQTLGVGDIFDFGNSRKKLDGNLNRSLKVHDYDQLLFLSGLYSQFEKENTNNISFKKHWSIVSQWNENCRYYIARSEADAKDFITSVKEIKLWIQKHL